MPTSHSTASDAEFFKSIDNSYTERFGTTVTLNKIVEVLDSQNRVISSTTIPTSIKADIQWITKKDLLHMNLGEVSIGDGILYTEVGKGISLEDEIVFNGVTWRIVSQIEGEQIAGVVVEEGYIIRKND